MNWLERFHRWRALGRLYSRALKETPGFCTGDTVSPYMGRDYFDCSNPACVVAGEIVCQYDRAVDELYKELIARGPVTFGTNWFTR